MGGLSGTNSFGGTHGSFKAPHTPSATGTAVGSSKMPQRPGSSKPIQKGGGLLSDNEQEKATKRPDSGNPKKRDQRASAASKSTRIRSASPNTLMLQKHQQQPSQGAALQQQNFMNPMQQQ